jgi:hypothetical protein
VGPLGALALLALLGPGTREAGAAVDRVCEKRFAVRSGNGGSLDLAYCSNVDLASGDPSVARAVVVVHGINRTADDSFDSMEDAGALAGNAHRTSVIVAPQFLAEEDVERHALPSNLLYWGSSGWKEGNTSSSTARHPRPFTVSSFEALDRILERLADRRAFPQIRQIVVAGHSAGGQFTNRYAAGGTAEAVLAVGRPDLAFRHVVANPSSYLYFSPERANAGSLDSFSAPDPRLCPGYDDYHYGLRDLNRYLSAVGAATIQRRYRSRRVVTMLGLEDDDPAHSSLDVRCEAMLQGRHRLERGEIYSRHVSRHFGAEIRDRHRFDLVPGAGHSARRMFQSDCGLRHLFGFDPGGDACTEQVAPAAGSELELAAFADDFEQGLGNWVQDSQQRWSASTRRRVAGNRSAQIGGRAGDAAIVSPEIELGEARRATVAFSWYITTPLDSGEYLAFDVSTDGGGRWVERARLRGNVEREGAWHHAHVDVTDADRLLLRFRGRMSRSDESANVDAVLVTIPMR